VLPVLRVISWLRDGPSLLKEGPTWRLKFFRR
jgi:hypothetical protein